VALLEILELLLMVLDGCLELLDVLSSALAKSSLGLSVPLLALFRGSVYLLRLDQTTIQPRGLTGFLPPFRFTGAGGSWEGLSAAASVLALASGSGDESDGLS
jgi:hypothetical protein